MITLIGLGLWNQEDITQRGLKKAKEADVLYLENYTSKLPGATKKDLEEGIGKKIQLANREFLESGEILNYAGSNDVALLIPGDPLVATTHSDLILRAKEKDIKTEIIHNASIYSAITETGLQIYKFGKATTVTFWKPNYKPESFYKTIKQNKERGLHTLTLLDLEKKEDRYLTAREAIRTLLEIEQDKEQDVFTEETDIVVVSRLGSPKKQVKYGSVKKHLQTDHGPPLHTIVVPGKLHEREKKYLDMYKIED